MNNKPKYSFCGQETVFKFTLGPAQRRPIYEAESYRITEYTEPLVTPIYVCPTHGTWYPGEMMTEDQERALRESDGAA